MVTMKSRLVVLTLICILLFSNAARADVIADRPGDISGTVNSQENAIQIGGGMQEIGEAQTSGAGSTQMSGTENAQTSGGNAAGAQAAGPVVTDAPALDPAGGNAASQTTGVTAGGQMTEIPVGPVIREQKQDGQSGSQDSQAGAQGASSEGQKAGSQTVIVLPEQKNAVIKAPDAKAQDGNGAKEQTETGVSDASAAAAAKAAEPAGIQLISEPSSLSGAVTGTGADAPKESTVEVTAAAETKEAAPAGPVSAGPGNQRVSLNFGIVSPAHNTGNQNLAIGSVELADGSWQALGYDAGIHAPYYKLLRETVDSMGTAWYVVKYSGNRIGNAHTSDGTIAGEVWLLKSDCKAKNYIDIATANATRGKIVAAALELLGSRYAYGGAGPESFDCSGLVKYVCDKAGIKVPRTSSELAAMSGKVELSKLRPGDICVRNGHAGIYIGNDVFIHASEAAVGVVAEYLSSYNAINKFTTYINVVGD